MDVIIPVFLNLKKRNKKIFIAKLMCYIERRAFKHTKET